MVGATWSDRRVGVLGLGRSGRAATRLLEKVGATVYASDLDDGEELQKWAAAAHGPRVEVQLGGHDIETLASCDLLVLSPGIPPFAEVLQSPSLHALPMISELELAFNFLAAPVIAVTGTNGKTTTTAWIGSMLKRAGVRVGIGGNIGLALSEIAVSGADLEWVVVEVSSFQLAYTERFRPAIGVFLNLCPDHVDWHGSVENYYAAKARFFDNAQPETHWVLNAEDAGVMRIAADRPGSAYSFRVESEPKDDEEGAYLAGDGTLTLQRAGERVDLVGRQELRLLGLHNVANALATSLAATLADLPAPAVRDGLRGFEPLSHRLQPVAEDGGVLWVNDSKATNVSSTRVALQSMDRPVVLLLGGRAKGENFSSLLPELGDRVRCVIAYGEAAGQIEAELGDHIEVVRESGPFEDVVRRAADAAQAGDVVLLAPACASFDMFRDYEERGERFGQLARRGMA
jgi:UDP-N-acetylmuramoylalanine--D-glutamate ligase